MAACERRASRSVEESEMACNYQCKALRTRFSSEPSARDSHFRQCIDEVRGAMARASEDRGAQGLAENEAYQRTWAQEFTEKACAERAALVQRLRAA